MSDDNPQTNISRRSLLRKAGLGVVAGTPVFGGFSGTAQAASDVPYDKVQTNGDSTTIRYTKNALWHNLVKISVSSTVTSFGAFWTDDGRWNHKFGIDTQAISYHTQDEALRPNIKNQSTKIDAFGLSSIEINGKPVGSGYVGATPADSNDDLQHVFTTALRAAASLLSQRFAVASAATAIANSLKEVGSMSCSSSSLCTKYEWTYWQNKNEVAHQAKWWATIGPTEGGIFEVTTQADSETGISFLVDIGGGGQSINPTDPPSSTSTQDTSKTERTPKYITREELEDSRSRIASMNRGLKQPQAMSEKEAKAYNVQKLDSPQTIVVNGKKKRATHVATNIPTQTIALEPREKYK